MLQLITALGGTATLHVAVHRDAGTVYDIAADGASGQCVVLGTSWVACPASGPVSFRWGGDGEWGLEGDSAVHPGQTGTAFVLPAPELGAERRARLAEGPVDAALVRELFLRTSDREIPPMTSGLFEDFLGLAEHQDWRVRRAFVRSLVPYARHTASDPFPSDAPSRIPRGLLIRLSQDPDRRVRRRTAALFRELGPEDPRTAEANVALKGLVADRNPGVRRVAVAVMTGSESEPLEAWRAALTRVESEGAPGRAACNGLAKLHRYVDPAEVDADGALALILAHHPERAWRYWAAWRVELGYDAVRAEYLLRDTVGLSQKLLRYWATENPEQLAATVARWEPEEPHSDRFRVVAGWLDAHALEPGLRAALGLPAVADDRLSKPPGSPEGE